MTLLAALAFQGFALAINGVAAPWMMTSFGLDQAGMARAFAWISLSAIGAFLLARQADHYGRRRVMAVSMAIGTLAAVAAALSTSLPIFIAFDAVVLSTAGAVVAGAVVWTAETSHDRNRASGQAFAGLAVVLGSGPCVLLMPWLAATDRSWRVLFFLFASSLVLVPFLPREAVAQIGSDGADTDGPPEGGHYVQLRQGSQLIRRHAVILIITTVLSTIATATVDAWRYVHMVSDARLAPATASTLIVIAGVAAMIGFPLGTLASNRFGRVRSTAGGLLMMTAAISVVFWGPPHSIENSWLWFGAGFFVIALSGNAITVAANTAVNELFPSTFRATMFGALNVAGSLGRVGAQTLVAALAPHVASASTAVGVLALAGIPAAVLLVGLLPEPLERGDAAQSADLQRSPRGFST
jgi:MFS family permease